MQPAVAFQTFVGTFPEGDAKPPRTCSLILESLRPACPSVAFGLIGCSAISPGLPTPPCAAHGTHDRVKLCAQPHFNCRKADGKANLVSPSSAPALRLVNPVAIVLSGQCTTCASKRVVDRSPLDDASSCCAFKFYFYDAISKDGEFEDVVASAHSKRECRCSVSLSSCQCCCTCSPI